MGQTKSPSDSNSRFLLSASLCCNVLSLRLLALVDSGAEEIFLDQQVAVQAGNKMEPLKEPGTALAVVGRLFARVTHLSEPLTLILSSNDREAIQFHILSTLSTPHILGHPWLVKHHPSIDWAKRRVTEWSAFCHAFCLQSAQFPVGGVSPSSSPVPEPPNLSNIPKEYHDLQDAFNKSKALSLPHHRPYDCTIDLPPGAPLPLYDLSKPEHEAMEPFT